MKTVTKILSGMAVVASLAATSAVFAANGAASVGVTGINQGNKILFGSQQHQAVEQAIEEGNYAKWYELMTQNGRQPKITEVINEANFGKLKEIRDAMENKDIESAKVIADELGLPGSQGKGRLMGDHGRRDGKGAGMMGPRDPETRDAIRTAVENGDYEAFKTLVTQDGRGEELLEKVTPENFAKLKEMHDAMESGDKESAKSIADELGIKAPRGKGKFRPCEHGRGGQMKFDVGVEENGVES